MKTKALYLTFVSISILAFLSVSLFASDCGKKLNCPAGIKYPYRFCELEANGNTKQIVVCTDDPLGYEAANSTTYPKTFAMKAKLPIYPDLFGQGDSLYKGMEYINKYRDGVRKVVLFGEDLAPEGGASNQYNFVYNREILLAFDKWNCVCGFETDLSTAYTSGTVIKTGFTDNPEVLGATLDPYTTLGNAKTALKPFQDTEGGFYCNIDYAASKIYFNATPQFLFDLDSFPANKNTPIKKGWFSQEYLGNVSLVPNHVYLYSFLQVAMHEISHMLGFWHYDTNKLISVEQYCDNDGDTLGGVMKYNTKPRENLIELSLHDKCMMAKLYCPDLVVLNIFEYQPTTQKVYPNPGKYVVSFDFELPRYTEDLRMTVKDVLGQTLLIPIENAVYEAGKHTVLINVDSLAIGTYYIIIEAGAYRTAQPVMIVR